MKCSLMHKGISHTPTMIHSTIQTENVIVCFFSAFLFGKKNTSRLNYAKMWVSKVFTVFLLHLYSAFCSVKVCAQNSFHTLTHCSRKNNNSQHIHAFAGPRWCFHNDVRWGCEIQGEILDVGAIVILDAVNVDPTCGGLIQELSHGRFGDELRDSLGSILETKAETLSAS